MYRRPAWGETRQRSLDPGTLQGLCEVYPRGQPTPGCSLPEPDPITQPKPEPEPEPVTEELPTKQGCSTTSAPPLLGALMLLLGLRRART